MWGAWFEYTISAPYVSYGKYILKFSSRCNSAQFVCSVSSLNSFVFIKLDMWKCIKLILDKIWSIVSLCSCCILECFIYNKFFVYLHNKWNRLASHAFSQVSCPVLVSFGIHSIYRWIIMLEKCGRLDLNVFHLGTHGNLKKNPGGLPARRQWQSSPFPEKIGQLGWIGIAVLLVAPKQTPGFAMGAKTSI